jgi:CRP-like cAMP-binding protein
MTASSEPRWFLPSAPQPDRPTRQLSTGEQVLLPDHDELYAELTLRNRGLIGPDEQQRLRTATILVAGCGAIGGATIEPLLRAGAESLIQAEPGTYDYNKANRQKKRIQDVGLNKAAAFARKMPDINPYAQFEVHTDGITDANVADLVSRADLIIDGVDVTEPPAIRAKFALHTEAKRQRKPVIGGYDIAGTQWTPSYDYRNPDCKLFDGRLTEADLPGLTPLGFLSKVISPLKIPVEMIPEIERQLRGQSTFMPQLGYTALQFGVLVVRLAFDMLSNKPVKDSILIDIPSEVRPRRENLKQIGKRLALLYVVNNRMRGLKKAGRLGVYSPLDDDAFEDMRASMQPRQALAFEVIVRQGEPGDEFFIIEDGRVQVELDDASETGEPVPLAQLGPGDYFGELALLTDAPRNATVVALTDCALLSMTREAFERFLDVSAPAAKQIEKAAAARRRD